MIRKIVQEKISFAQWLDVFGWSGARRKNLNHIFVFQLLPRCFEKSQLEPFYRIGNRRLLDCSSGNDSRKSSLEFAKAQLKKKRIQVAELDLIIGHDTFHGIHELSSRPSFYFTFLRDPIERYIAQYNFFVSAVDQSKSVFHQLAMKLVTENGKTISLAEFADRKTHTNLMTRYLAAANPPDDETKRWGLGKGMKLFTLAAESLKRMDFVGLYESAQEDFSLISAKMNLESNPRASEASTELLQENIPGDLVEKIGKINRLDVALYDAAKMIRQRKLQPLKDSILQ